MKPTLNEDPFNAIAGTLETQVKNLRVKFDAFKAHALSVDTSSEPGFGGKYEEIKSEVRKTCEQCTKMRNSVSSVEQKREQFPHIDDRELESRKNVAERLRVLASRLQAELHSPDVAGKIVSDDRRALARKSRVAEDASRTQSAHYQGNSSHLAGAGNEQKLIVKQQDVVLDKLESGLDTLNEMANVIQAEVKDQEGVLDDISNKTDEAQNKMTGAIASINKLLGTNNSCQLATVGILVLVFIILASIALT